MVRIRPSADPILLPTHACETSGREHATRCGPDRVAGLRPSARTTRVFRGFPALKRRCGSRPDVSRTAASSRKWSGRQTEKHP